MAGINGNPGRLPRPIPNLTRGEWDEKMRRDLEEFLRSVYGGMSALSGTPDVPVDVQAGVVEDIGVSLTKANSDHRHSAETATPSVNVQLGGSPDEGSGSSLMRADATLVLDSGGATDGQVLVWNAATSAWVPQEVETEDILVWMDL